MIYVIIFIASWLVLGFGLTRKAAERGLIRRHQAGYGSCWCTSGPDMHIRGHIDRGVTATCLLGWPVPAVLLAIDLVAPPNKPNEETPKATSAVPD